MKRTQAFEHIAANYDRARPSYPEAAVDGIARAIRTLPSTSRQVADVGSGTGIFSRLLREHLPESLEVVGIEPGHEMRQLALRHAVGGIRYLQATAEELPFDSGSVRAMTVAQALQWFDRPAFYREASRSLQANGVLFVIQNNRQWAASPFLATYEGLLEECSPNYDRNYRNFDVEDDLVRSSLFVAISSQTYTWEQEMSAAQFRDMSLSSTKMKAAVELHGSTHMIDRVDRLIDQFFPSGSPIVDYRTEVYAFRPG